MAQKEVASINDTVFLPIFIVTLILISVLIGDFVSTFILSLISIILISFVYSIIKLRKFNKELMDKIKESSYILSFSFLTTLIITIILPYVLFDNSFVNIFVIQYVYLLPILLIFFLSLFFYTALVNKVQPNLNHIIKSSLVVSLIISVAISLFLIIGSNHIYNQRTQIYNQQFDTTISELNAKSLDLYKADYQIFNEIKTYQNNFIEKVIRQRETFQNIDVKRGFCIQTNCAKSIVDKAHNLIIVVVNSEVIRGTLKEANEEVEYINSEEFKQNFTSLDEYKIYLKNKIDSSQFTLTSLSDENKNTLDLLESEFTYQDFQNLKEKINQKEENVALVSVFSESGLIFETNSLFFNSLSYTMEHSEPFRELLRLVMKVSIYTREHGKNSDLFVEIYNNKDIDESTESKIIRYKLISNRIEK